MSEALKKTLVINLYGISCAEKCAFAFNLTNELSAKGYSAQCISEMELLYQYGNDIHSCTYDTQKEIAQTQFRKIALAYTEVNFIVTDSPLLERSAYVIGNKAEFETQMMDLYNCFDNFNLYNTKSAGLERESGLNNSDKNVKVSANTKEILKRSGCIYRECSKQSVSIAANNIVKYYRAVFMNDNNKTAEQIARNASEDIKLQRKFSYIKDFISDGQKTIESSKTEISKNDIILDDIGFQYVNNNDTSFEEQINELTSRNANLRDNCNLLSKEMDSAKQYLKQLSQSVKKNAVNINGQNISGWQHDIADRRQNQLKNSGASYNNSEREKSSARELIER